MAHGNRNGGEAQADGALGPRDHHRQAPNGAQAGCVSALPLPLRGPSLSP